jgi:Tfp pilus assembly protein PilF/RNA polymerase subunit RPABC4/transcription elongation factor Spt4
MTGWSWYSRKDVTLVCGKYKEENLGEIERYVDVIKQLFVMEEKMNCKKCNAEIADNTKFCPECGTKVDTPLICVNCGIKLAENAKFCPECGTKVGDTLFASPGQEIKAKTSVPQEQEQKSLQLCKKGYKFMEKGNFDKALPFLEEAVHLNPNNAQAFLYRGICYANQEEFDDAIRDLTEALNLDAVEAGELAYYWRAMANYHDDNYNNALADVNEAINLDAKDVWNFNLRGNIYTALNNLDSAMADYNKALRLDPDNETVKENIQNIEDGVVDEPPAGKPGSGIGTVVGGFLSGVLGGFLEGLEDEEEE